jgi:AcrR family transcriptional regulator
VPRVPELSRREELLGSIVDHLGGSSLADLSFRTLARSLGVSTYALVYHFGSREQLISEIVRAIAERQKIAEEAQAEVSDLDSHLAKLRASFEWQLQPENIKLQRLEFEAAMLEALDPERHTHTRGTFGYWMAETERTLIDLGVPAGEAAAEARILNNLFYGFQYDLVLNRDPGTVKKSFDLVIERYRRYLQNLIERSV